jgi:hypothetical protein
MSASGLWRALLCVWLSLTATAAFAWNDAGHMLSALIAYDRLSDDARESALALLADHPRYREDFLDRMPSRVAEASATERNRWLFAAASVWPDYVRTFDGVVPEARRTALVARYHRPRWHYINQPLFLDQAERAALAPVATNDAMKLLPGMSPDEMNLVQALSKAERDLAAPGSNARRAVALCWVLHLTADLHQPLHTVALFTTRAFPAGDRGGNLISVGKRETLHSLWDGAAARDRRWGSVQRVFAALPSSALPPDEGVDIAAWAREGAALADTAVYVTAFRDVVRVSDAPSPGSTIRVDLPSGYLASMRTTARRQITAAGVRTALVLQPLLEAAKKAA